MTENDGSDTTSRWEEEPGDKLTSMLAAVQNALADWNEDKAGPGEHLHGIFVLHDGQGHSGAGAMGYDQDPGHKMVADFIKFSNMLFAASGVRMDVRFIHDDIPPEADEGLPAEHFKPMREHSDPGRPRALLTVTHSYPDPAIPETTKAVKSAIEANMDLDGIQTVILLKIKDGNIALMQHGFDDRHEMVHALLGTLMSLAAEDEDTHMMVIPVTGHPN
jgi:hypothetical protein